MKLTTNEAGADDGVPGVVYIDAPEVVVRGEFYANILLTEQPMGNTFPVIVDGGKGTAGDPEWLRSVWHLKNFHLLVRVLAVSGNADD